MTNDIQNEIGQQRPFKSAEHKAHVSLVRTASLLLDEMEQVLRPAGITLAQYNVLRILRGAEPQGLCRNQIRDRMVSRMADMTRLLDRMETAGLVERARDAEDRRLVTTRLTDAGRKILDGLENEVAEEHRRRFARLSESQIESLIELLGLVRSSL